MENPYGLRIVRETKNVEQFAKTVLPEDLQRVLSGTYVAEVDAQKRMGNPPIITEVDGGKHSNVANVKRRARAFFSNKARVADAAFAALEMLLTLTPVLTGRARASFALYLNDAPLGGGVNIDAATEKMRPRDLLSIVGPGVPYGRKLYRRPLGKTRRINKKRNGKRDARHGKFREPMHAAVVRVLKSRYKDLVISEHWVPLQHSTGPQGEKWPGIGIGFKGRKRR